MNSLHYPSLELCKKLTEIGFPKTQMERIQNSFLKDWIGMTDKARNELFDPRCFENLCSTADVKRHYVCPSVMEMLYEMPNRVEIKHGGIEWYVTLADSEGGFFDESLPDAIAEMYIWLHENNYLTFNI